MLDCLMIDDKYWISGKDLLKLADITVKGLLGTGIPSFSGKGDRADPWVLTGNPKDWLYLATKKLDGQKEQYFAICGRRIKKFANSYYMVDAGSMSTKGTGAVWNTKDGKTPFTDGGPSYRNFSATVMRIGGRKDVTAWTQEFAKHLLLVLQRDRNAFNICSAPQAAAETETAVLPTLAATLFLAEPARNELAFLVNKMLIQMVAFGYTYGGRKTGSTPKTYRIDTLLHREENQGGGKIPAAMARSAEASGQKHGYNPLIGTAITKKEGPSYTQSKELTIICRYFTFNYFQGTNQALLPKGCQQIVITDFGSIETSMYKPGASFEVDPAKVPGYLKYLLQQAMVSFEN